MSCASKHDDVAKVRARRPRRIVLIRHGQSLGNVDETEYTRTPDSRVALTTLGQEQARGAGAALAKLLQSDPGDVKKRSNLFVYSSPYTRCQQTLEHVLLGANIAPESLIGNVQEPRLREQDFGNFQDATSMAQSKDERQRFGRFYYRFPQGESGADVYDRVSTWLESLFRQMTFGDIDQDTTLLIVTHGLTARLFLMRWFHWTVDEFEASYNPPNGQLLIMERGDLSGRGSVGYQLTADTRVAMGLGGESSTVLVETLGHGGASGELDQPLSPMDRKVRRDSQFANLNSVADALNLSGSPRQGTDRGRGGKKDSLW